MASRTTARRLTTPWPRSSAELSGALLRACPRLRIMAHAIRHEQQGEIALMFGAAGPSAVASAFRNMFADNVNH